jgi:hypothetical protein
VLPVALLGAVLAAAPAAPGAAAASPRPVIIVEDAEQLRRLVGPAAEGTFTPSQDEAEAPRLELPRYLQTERAREKNRYRREQLHQIDEKRARYVWHCGGYTKGKERYLYCTFVTPGWPEIAQRKEFPGIKDGGTSVCNLTFRLATKTIRAARLERRSLESGSRLLVA